MFVCIVRIISKDIIKFGMEKCAVLVLKLGRLAQSEGSHYLMRLQ